MSETAITCYEGEIVVVYSMKSDPEDVKDLCENLGLGIIDHKPKSYCYIVEVPEGEEDQWMERLMREDPVQACFRYTTNMSSLF